MDDSDMNPSIEGKSDSEVYRLIYGDKSDEVFVPMPIEIAFEVVKDRKRSPQLRTWAKDTISDYLEEFV